MKYRLTEVVYENYIAYEDGSGSLQNICSKRSPEKVIWLGNGEYPPTKELLDDWLRWNWLDLMEEDVADGMVECDYKLSVWEENEKRWRYVASIDSRGYFLRRFK